MKNWISLVFVALAIVIIGCGGGGGGGGTTSTTTTTTTTSTGISQGITGMVRNVSLQPISNAKITFYNKTGSEVGTTRTGVDGKFAAELPTSVQRFTADFSGIPSSSQYFHQFGYGNFEYLENDPSCTAPAPTVTAGDVKALPHDIVIMQLWFGPPPPPDGCVGG